MALIPSARYPGQTDTDPAYPQGKARNSTAFQDGTGTPLEADWLNDVWGFLQALLDEAAIVPTGTPDEVGASQYLAAIQSLTASTSLNDTLYRAATMRALNLQGAASASGPDPHMAAHRDSRGRTLLLKRDVFSVGDSDIVRMNGVLIASGYIVRSVAFNGTRLLVVGSGGTVGNFFSDDDGATWTAGGAFSYGDDNESVVWDGTEFIATDGVESAHSTNGVTWLDPTGDDIGDAITATAGGGFLAVLTPGTVVTTNGKHVAVTTNHGVAWVAAADIPSTLAGTVNSHVVGRGDGVVYAFLKEEGSTTLECWVSSNASTWTLRSSLTGHDANDASPGFGFRARMCPDTGLLAVASGAFSHTLDEGTIVSVSGDLGLTWAPNLLYDGGVMPLGIALANGRIVGAGVIGGIGSGIWATDPLLVA